MPLPGVDGTALGVAGVACLDHVAIVIPDLHENIPWLHDFGRRFGHLVPHVLDMTIKGKAVDTEVDVSAGRIIVELPEGLRELTRPVAGPAEEEA